MLIIKKGTSVLNIFPVHMPDKESYHFQKVKSAQIATTRLPSISACAIFDELDQSILHMIAYLYYIRPSVLLRILCN